MNETIIVGVLSLVGTLAGSFASSRLTIYRINQLEKKVDKHNNFAERMPLIERDVEVLKKESEHHEFKIEEHEKILAVVQAK